MPKRPPLVLQAKDYDCGCAAAESLLRHHGVEPEPWVARLANPHVGMGTDVAEAVLWDAFDGRLARGYMPLDVLRHHTAAGRPVMCLVTLDLGGHWVLAWHVSGRSVHVMCPTNGFTTMTLPAWRKAHTTENGELPRFGLCPWPAAD